jgi:uncharacterized membrane protein YdjX (TVP38/TMEM64 family)
MWCVRSAESRCCRTGPFSIEESSEDGGLSFRRNNRGPGEKNTLAEAAGGVDDAARALLVLFVISLVFSLGIGGVLSLFFPLGPREAHEFIRSLGIWGPVGIVATIACLIVFVPVPTIPFDIAAGVGYGALPGSLCVLAGHIVGASAAFLLARRFGRPLLRRVVTRRVSDHVDGLASRLAPRLVVLMRLLPLFDFKVVSYAAGLTDMAFSDYILATTVGIALPVFGMVAVGSQLTDHPLRAALIVGVFGLVAGLAAAYLLFGRERADRSGTGRA